MELGKFEILEELGRGGFGTVYKARDIALDRLVAVKELHPGLTIDPTFISRFKHEAQIAANLDHPNLVPVYELGQAEGRYYIVMGYMPGGSLKDLLKNEGPLSKERTFEILQQIGAGLAYAHKQGVIHRDLKPGNILFDAKGQARVSDLGFAKLLHSQSSASMSTSGGLVGTPAYMAPEIWRGKGAGASTDIYSLVCILVEMLTAKPLFDGESTPEVMFKHFEPLQLPEDLPQEWKAVLEQGLEKKPEERIGNVDDLISRLQQAGRWTAPTIPDVTKREDLKPQREPSQEAAHPPAIVESVKQDQVAAKQAQNSRENEENPDKPSSEVGEAHFHTPDPISEGTQKSSSAFEKEKTGVPHKKTPLYLGLGVLVLLVIFLIIRSEIFSAQPQSTVAPSPTAVLGVGSTKIREQDGMEMVYVPEGSFEMGSMTGEDNEKPVRQVYLDAYWIDKFEVTNGQFEKCVNEGVCSKPTSTGSLTRDRYYGDSTYANYPVIYVSWDQAQDYCQWVGGELPTEAQWEKAARGIDGREYPWGRDFDCGRGNFDDETQLDDYVVEGGPDCDGYIDTAPVGTYSKGASPYGALDMAGNVWEWVRDWYGPYDPNKTNNPVGPASGESRLLRGGSWYNLIWNIRTADRNNYDPTNTDDSIGFRCISPP